MPSSSFTFTFTLPIKPRYRHTFRHLNNVQADCFADVLQGQVRARHTPPPLPSPPTSLTHRYEELCADPNTVLGGPKYQYMEKQLVDYCDLLMKYGVKQTEMERVKKLGASLGFSFPKGKAREPNPKYQ